MPAMFKQWIARLFRRPAIAAAPRITARTSPPLCPLCRGLRTVAVGLGASTCLGIVIGRMTCHVCGGAGVVPACTLARDPGDFSELRQYVAAAGRN